jgi:hypothetical protein
LSFTLTGWARGRSRDDQHEQAVRIQLMRPDFDLNELIEQQRQASGTYRREYGTWAAEIGGYAEGPDGFRHNLPPGRRMKEHGETGYRTEDGSPAMG